MKKHKEEYHLLEEYHAYHGGAHGLVVTKEETQEEEASDDDDKIVEIVDVDALSNGGLSKVHNRRLTLKAVAKATRRIVPIHKGIKTKTHFTRFSYLIFRRLMSSYYYIDSIKSSPCQVNWGLQ